MKVVNLMHNANCIYLDGIGASFLVAKDLQQKLERINKKYFLYEDIHLELVNPTNIDNGDIAIGISYSGLTKEMLK